MIKRTATFPIVTAALALLVFTTPMAVHAQGYEGVVAEDGGFESSIDNDGGGQRGLDIFAPDYYKTKAEQERANTKAFRAQLIAERETLQAAREAEAKAAQEAIDARVEAAVSAPSDYGTRIDGLKAPPPQMPETQPPETQPVVQPTPGTGGGTTVGGGGASGGGDSGGDRGGSVLERMMNQLQ